MKKLKFLAILAAILAILVMCVPAAAGTSVPPKSKVKWPINLTGTLNNAAYEILVPPNWNGTLLVYAHGYSAEVPKAEALPDSAMRTLLLTQGYALAGTANKAGGWAVKEGVQNNLAMVNFFKGKVGNPDRVILLGFSMGSAIALESIEKYPGIYDGAITGGSLGAGTPRNFDLSLAFSLAYDVAFGWPADWGTVGDVKDDLNFERDVLPVLMYKMNYDTAYLAKIEFIRLVCEFPETVYGIPSWFFTDMFYATQVRAELEKRAGGPVAQNLDQLYSLDLTPLQIAFFASFGINPDAWLDEMNSTEISASKPARNYAGHYATFSGDLKRPVITIQTSVDEVVRVANEGVYLDLVQAAGKEDYLVQVFTSEIGHVNFTGPQLFCTLNAMESWLDTGVKPGPAFFPGGLGFVPGFVPEDWPFGIP